MDIDCAESEKRSVAHGIHGGGGIKGREGTEEGRHSRKRMVGRQAWVSRALRSKLIEDNGQMHNQTSALCSPASRSRVARREAPSGCATIEDVCQKEHDD